MGVVPGSPFFWLKWASSLPQADRQALCFHGNACFQEQLVTVGVPNTRQGGEYGDPWVVVLLRGHMQGSLAQARCRCCTPRG